MIRPDQTLTEEKVHAICEFAQKGFCSPSTLNKLGAHARKVAVTAALGLSVAGASSADGGRDAGRSGPVAPTVRRGD